MLVQKMLVSVYRMCAIHTGCPGLVGGGASPLSRKKARNERSEPSSRPAPNDARAFTRIYFDKYYTRFLQEFNVQCCWERKGERGQKERERERWWERKVLRVAVCIGVSVRRVHAGVCTIVYGVCVVYVHVCRCVSISASKLNKNNVTMCISNLAP